MSGVDGLEGATNFRDFGGWPTQDGRSVRTGLLYRSNALTQVSENDRRVLDGLGVRVIYDLRSRSEREAAPTDWTPEGLAVRTFRPRHKRRLADMAADYPPDAAGVRRLMHDFYSDLPFVYAPVIAAVIEGIAEGGAPCIVHCSAGKDRTGIVCALLLAALQVARPDILKDYAATNRRPNPERDMARAVAPREGEDALRRRYPPEAVAAMTAADPAYLEAAFTAVDGRYALFEDYLEAELGLGPARLAFLRAHLLDAGARP